MTELIRNITIKQFKKEDLCIEDFAEEHLYDYFTIEEFYESIVYDLNQETDIIEFDNVYKSSIEQAKHIKVFKKLPTRIDYGSIENYIEEWYYDNASGVDFDYEVDLTEKAKILLEKLVKEIHKHNQVYKSGAFVGYIDLSSEVQEYIETYKGANQ